LVYFGRSIFPTIGAVVEAAKAQARSRRAALLARN
jgi:hypothetical protein